jgi:hypothetical protein
MLKHLSILTAALALTACATPGVVSNAPIAAAEREVTVRGQVRQVGPGYSLQALLVPFELKRLSKIEVYLKNVTDQGDWVAKGNLAYKGSGDADHVFDPISMANLKANKTYQVLLKAYQVVGQAELRADDQSKANITEFSTSSTLVVGGSQDLIEVTGGFKLQLSDQKFEGVASGDVVATDGKLIDPSDDEVLTTKENG